MRLVGLGQGEGTTWEISPIPDVERKGKRPEILCKAGNQPQDQSGLRLRRRRLPGDPIALI